MRCEVISATEGLNPALALSVGCMSFLAWHSIQAGHCQMLGAETVGNNSSSEWCDIPRGRIVAAYTRDRSAATTKAVEPLMKVFVSFQ